MFVRRLVNDSMGQARDDRPRAAVMNDISSILTSCFWMRKDGFATAVCGVLLHAR